MIFVGGMGLCFFLLMDDRVKFVVFFGGKYWIIDFILINCLYFGLCCILVLI